MLKMESFKFFNFLPHVPKWDLVIFFEVNLHVNAKISFLQVKSW